MSKTSKRTASANKPGRKTIYSPEIADEICQRLSVGEPLARICADPRMPGFTTVWEWERENDDLAKLSARARELGTHFMADDCLRIADDSEIDPQNKRIMVDTRLRLIGKWNAKAYGEKVQADLTTNGKDLHASDHELSARLAAIMDAAAKRRDGM